MGFNTSWPTVRSRSPSHFAVCVRFGCNATTPFVFPARLRGDFALLFRTGGRLVDRDEPISLGPSVDGHSVFLKAFEHVVKYQLFAFTKLQRPLMSPARFRS